MAVDEPYAGLSRDPSPAPEPAARPGSPERTSDDDRFRTLVEAAPDAMILTDEAGQLIVVNAQAEKLFGYPRSELLGRPVELLIPSRYVARHTALREEYAGAPRVRPMHSAPELVAQRKDGTELPVEISLSPIKTARGHQVLAAIRDLTARKKAEAIERQLAEAQASRAHAERAVQLRDDFVAIAGHELKTPLAALLMQLQSLQRTLRTGPVADLDERLAKAVRTGQRLEALVNQLLDVSRLSAGRLERESEPFDLAQLVREVVDRFSDASPAAAARPTLRAGAALELRGEWDRFRIDQALSNLISNAIKYGRGNPVELELAREAGWAVVRVIDQGIGIAPERRQRIFERFERAVETREFGGFGLGLWIASQIVKANGGTIEVDSQPGRGSTFTLRLPIRPAGAAQ